MGVNHLNVKFMTQHYMPSLLTSPTKNACEHNCAVRQPRTQDLSLGKTLASAGHVTPIRNCSRGRVGEFRIYN